MFYCVQIKLLVLDSITKNHLTVCQQKSFGSFKNNLSFAYHTYSVYMNKSDLALYRSWYLAF